MEKYIDTPYFSLEGMKCQAYVYSVYDGDTVTLIFGLQGLHELQELQEKEYKWKCRLSGIDTAELRTKNIKEKEYAYKVKEILSDKILNKIVDIECLSFDKYGRTLVKITYDNICINDWLIENGYAKKYDGGHKEEFK